MLETHRRSHRSGVVVHEAVGELDVATAPALRKALADLLATTDGCVVLDLARMTFIDAAGLGVLVWFSSAMAEAGRPTTIRGARPFTARILAVTGVDRGFSGGPRWW